MYGTMFCTDFHGPQSMNVTDFGDLTMKFVVLSKCQLLDKFPWDLGCLCPSQNKSWCLIVS